MHLPPAFQACIIPAWQARNPAKDMPIGIIGATSVCTIL
jgi:amino acid transporter